MDLPAAHKLSANCLNIGRDCSLLINRPYDCSLLVNRLNILAAHCPTSKMPHRSLMPISFPARMSYSTVAESTLQSTCQLRRDSRCHAMVTGMVRLSYDVGSDGLVAFQVLELGSGYSSAPVNTWRPETKRRTNRHANSRTVSQDEPTGREATLLCPKPFH